MTIFEEMRRDLKKAIMVGPASDLEARIDKCLLDYTNALELLITTPQIDLNPDPIWDEEC